MALKLRPRCITNIHYTLLVSLPKDWLALHDLSKRDKIAIEIGDEQEGRPLILRPHNEVENETRKQTSMQEANI